MAAANTVAMTLSEIEDLAFRALRIAGANETNARSVARSSAAAHADGVASHGLPYVPIYCGHVRCGKVKGDAVPVVARPKPAALVADAGKRLRPSGDRCRFRPAVFPLQRSRALPASPSAIPTIAAYWAGIPSGSHNRACSRSGSLMRRPPSRRRAALAKSSGTNPFAVRGAGRAGRGACPDRSERQHRRAQRDHAICAPRAKPSRRVGRWMQRAILHPTPRRRSTARCCRAAATRASASGSWSNCSPLRRPGPLSVSTQARLRGRSAGRRRPGQFFIAVDAGATSGGAFAGRVADLVAAIAEQPGARVHGAGRKAARARAAAGPIAVDAAIVEKVQALAA